MQSVVFVRPERCLSLFEIVREFKKILRNTPILWQFILFVPENTNGVMGLNISPSIWQFYINAILDCLQSKKYCEAIMNDFILFTPSKESHMNKLEDILSALLKNGLKISPKKCQLFKTSLQYMGNEIFIKSKMVCVKPLRSRLEAIQKLQPPKMPKGCRSFSGVVNFLSMFCPELQKLLKPIYDLKRKGGDHSIGEKNSKTHL